MILVEGFKSSGKLISSLHLMGTFQKNWVGSSGLWKKSIYYVVVLKLEPRWLFRLHSLVKILSYKVPSKAERFYAHLLKLRNDPKNTKVLAKTEWMNQSMCVFSNVQCLEGIRPSYETALMITWLVSMCKSPHWNHPIHSLHMLAAWAHAP